MIRTDVLVLGAGMVGIATALHLQARGRAVTLVDRRGPAEETSFGNAGLVQREGVVPYGFPQGLATILKYALNRSSEARYHLAALPRIAPALFRYWRAGSPARIAASARANRPLVERCLIEHEALMQDAGAPDALRRVGWLKVFRGEAAFEADRRAEEAASRDYGFAMRAVDSRAIADLEPHLIGPFAGGVFMPEPGHVADPGALGKAYAGLFERRGGRFFLGDARSLGQTRDGWRVATEAGPVAAAAAVVALGAWSGDLLAPLGYKLPLFAKRGYHMHYRATGNAVLNRVVIDADAGAALAPMARGLRLTTGAEFSTIGAAPTPVQVDQTEPVARRLFPLGERLDPAPWLGRRPCLPDMLPIVGPAPRHPGLWLHFGHHHLGFTLGPTTGRLLAEMMTGETPFTDPAPYRADRF